LEIIKQLPKIKIKMVGKWLEDEFKADFVALLKKHKATENIEIVGAVSEEALSTYYSNALVLLQTNDDRGFGMPAMEAAAHGTTFIIPDGQGVCSLFTNGKEGFYTLERDTATITKHLKKLLNDTKLATEIGHKAWKKVKETYSWDKHAEELKALSVKALK
jgi:glycosyltransferase involved in cell wall biosynthesis